MLRTDLTFPRVRPLALPGLLATCLPLRCKVPPESVATGGAVDTDLEELSREQLVLEIVRLRNGIRAHRDSTGHELCWHHPHLWSLLPEVSDPQPTVPDWPQFMRGCIRYRQSLDEQLPQAPRIDEPFRG